jgi:DNA-directed RNA polymerase specialized sigma subunit
MNDQKLELDKYVFTRNWIEVELFKVDIVAHLSILDDRERIVICYLVGVGDEAVSLTEVQIAELCGISVAYVNRIGNRALFKIMDAITR